LGETICSSYLSGSQVSSFQSWAASPNDDTACILPCQIQHQAWHDHGLIDRPKINFMNLPWPYSGNFTILNT
jgi:hypothetical protein